MRIPEENIWRSQSGRGRKTKAIFPTDDSIRITHIFIIIAFTRFIFHTRLNKKETSSKLALSNIMLNCLVDSSMIMRILGA